MKKIGRFDKQNQHEKKGTEPTEKDVVCHRTWEGKSTPHLRTRERLIREEEEISVERTGRGH